LPHSGASCPTGEEGTVAVSNPPIKVIACGPIEREIVGAQPQLTHNLLTHSRRARSDEIDIASWRPDLLRSDTVSHWSEVCPSKDFIGKNLKEGCSIGQFGHL
jgi:hypothetical protein